MARILAGPLRTTEPWVGVAVVLGLQLAVRGDCQELFGHLGQVTLLGISVWGLIILLVWSGVSSSRCGGTVSGPIRNATVSRSAWSPPPEGWRSGGTVPTARSCGMSRSATARFREASTPIAKVVAGFLLWIVVFGSKFLVLETVHLVFGSRVSLAGFISVTILILVLLLSRAAWTTGISLSCQSAVLHDHVRFRARSPGPLDRYSQLGVTPAGARWVPTANASSMRRRTSSSGLCSVANSVRTRTCPALRSVQVACGASGQADHVPSGRRGPPSPQLRWCSSNRLDPWGFGPTSLSVCRELDRPTP
jgi:hypothetical protein